MLNKGGTKPYELSEAQESHGIDEWCCFVSVDVFDSVVDVIERGTLQVNTIKAKTST